jgi:hypothetical protein
MIAGWDHVVGRVRATGEPGSLTDAAIRYLGVASLDFAIRVAAVEALVGCPASPAALSDDATVPIWARAGAVREHLRAIPAALGTSWERIYATSATSKAKDEWLYRGSRPSLESLKDLARRLAALERSATPAHAWHLFLAWGFALESLSDALAAVIGRSAMEDIAARVHRTRMCARAYLASEPRKTPELHELIILGAHAPGAHLLIEQLVSGERQATVQAIERYVHGEALSVLAEGCRRAPTPVGARSSRVSRRLGPVSARRHCRAGLDRVRGRTARDASSDGEDTRRWQHARIHGGVQPTPGRYALGPPHSRAASLDPRPSR